MDKARILLGVTGGIAAYKSCELVRLLQKSDYEVKIVMTPHATQFIGPATFRALTGHEVALDLFEDPSQPIHHISLAQEPDCFVIAPATANVIAKIAQGVADDLLTTTAVAYKGPMVVAPAMNDAMLRDETTQENLDILRTRGIRIVEPESGYLACGDEGTGRLADIAHIKDAVDEEFSHSVDLTGKHVIITAGPTREPIDAVSFISNRSSGKMGYALAYEALARGAEVTLISGPTQLRAPEDAQVISITTAQEMYDAVLEVADQANMVICSAAVSDFSPVAPYQRKLKKRNSDDPGALENLVLKENPDILASVGALRTTGELPLNPLIIGFAAETENVVDNARAKLISKGVDYIVANNVSKSDIGFDSEHNEVRIVSSDSCHALLRAPKRVIARQIFDTVKKDLARLSG